MRRWICAVCALMCVGMVTAQQMSWHAASSGSVRVDARTVGGGRLATGTEMLTAALGALTCDGAAVGERWETATLADGWHSLAAGTNVVQTLTLNGPAVRVVGGRLLENTQWGGIIGNPITYVVRHWVVVPKGVTLTIATDVVVKFAPGTGIWVEDGGMVHVVSISPGEGAVFTALADDAEREDTNWDGAASEPEKGSWRVVVAPEGLFNDDGQLRTSYGAPMPGWTTVAVGDAVASERDGVVRVPITVPNARQEEYVEWETVHGTARAGEDYEATSGILMWGVGSAATQYATIPLVQDGMKEETEVFFVRLKAAWGLNVARGTATVTLNDSSSQPFEEFVWGKGTSAPVRVDARTTFGGYLAHGEEMLCATDEELACDGIVLTTNMWDSATVTDGPHTLTWGNLSSVVVALNAPEVAIEGGRLTADAEWDCTVTHVVRHWVVVPDGVTLTVTEGTVAKFAPGAGIWVEDGGTLRVEGSETNLVTFTHAADNTFGARVTFSDEVPEMNAYAIVKAPGGTFEDNGWLAARWLDVATFGRVTLHPATVAADSGEIRIPVTVSGTREAPFIVRWVAEAGTAKPDEDYLLAEGTLSWTGTKEGTKYIVIPTRDNPENTGNRTFFVRVLTACGMNASMVSVSATLYRNGAETLMDAAWHAGASASARVDVRVEDSGRLAHGTEALTAALGAPMCDGTAVEGAWETAALADGWHTLSAGTNAVRVLTLNGVGLAVEGGRLAQDTVWGPEAVHVVRHWVVVPKGVTLAVAAGTVAKFAPGAGIWVEDGGTLSITGEAGRDVVFTHLADDSVGGDTDAAPMPDSLAWNAWRIVGAPGATLSDNGFWQVRYHTMATGFAALTLHDALTERRQGEVWVPLTVSGTRTVPFSVDWSLETGSEDSLTGTLTWGKVAEGTKFIRVPVPEAVSEAGLETLTLRLTAVRGANIHDREAAVTVYDATPAVEEAILAASWQSADNRPTSPSATVQTLSGDFQSTLILDGQQVFRYSPRWQEGAAEGCVAEILCARTDGKASQTLFRGTEGEEGEFLWKVRNLDDGEYLLTHRVVGPEGKVRASVSRLLRYIATVELHGGLVAEDETWGADRVHLVYADVTVAAGKTLTIEPGAIVKFCDGTGLYSEDYTATTLANGVTFTHFADDTMGGDTNLDGSRSQPKHGAYTLGGHIVVDETSDIRCRHPQTLASLTAGQSVTLESGNVYLVEKSLTFASGSTLTIEPGVIVKFAPGTSLTIAQGATLLAKGTRAAPIILTSLKDDAHGGDTNGDGDATAPQAGDWQSIHVSGGVARFEHTHIFYGCRSQKGTLYLTGNGTIDFCNGGIYESAYDAIGCEGGSFTMENSVVSGAATAFRHYAAGQMVNCVFHQVGKLTQGGGQIFRNCIFVDVDTKWEAFGWSSTYTHCVFWNSDGESVRDGMDAKSVTGKNGNVWGDPCFVNPANGDFHILPGSAAVDMADGSVAPALDFYGQPRMDVEEAANTGTPSANGAFPDAGIHELMPRTATADIDFAVVSVEVPESGLVGQTATFAWTVRNIGSKAAEGTWRDTLSLVNDAGEEIPLGTYPVSGYVAPDGVKRTERTLILPPMGEGAWRLRVVANAYRDLFEGTLVANNVGESEAQVEVSVEYGEAIDGWSRALLPEEVAVRAFTLSGQERICLATLPTGVTLRVGFGFVPSATKTSGLLVESGALTIPKGLGTLYCVLENDGPMEGVFDLRFTDFPLALSAVCPSTLPREGRLTVSIEGAGFTDACELRLPEAPEGALCDVRRVSEECLLVEVDCTLLQAGKRYSVEVVDGTKRAILSDAIEVVRAPVPGTLWAKLELPEATRPGRVYTCALIYGNKGELPLRAPVLQVRVEKGGGVLWRDGSEAKRHSLSFIGAGRSAVAGMVAPGEVRRVQFCYRAGNSDSISLHSSDGKDFAPAPWGSTEEYLEALSVAATRIALRGGDAMAFEDVLALASMEKEGSLSQRIQGRVQTEEGEPVGYATVRATLADMAVEFDTDAQGVFLSSDLAPGIWKLSCADAKEPLDVVVYEGKDTFGVDLRVVRNHTVAVRLEDSERETYTPTSPIAVVAQSTDMETAMHTYTAVPGEDGVWRFVNLPQGGYTLAAVDGNVVGRAFVQVGAEATLGIVPLAMKPCGALSGRVDIEGMSEPSLLAKGVEEVRFALLDPEGGFRLERLPVGPWELSVYDAKGESFSLGTAEVTFGIETVWSAPMMARNVRASAQADVDLAFWRVRDAAREWLAVARQTLRNKAVHVPTYDCQENEARHQAYLREQRNFARQVDIFAFAVERYTSSEGLDVAKKVARLLVELADSVAMVYGHSDGETFSDFYEAAEDTISMASAFGEIVLKEPWSESIAGGIVGGLNVEMEQIKSWLNDTEDAGKTAIRFGERIAKLLDSYENKSWTDTTWEDVNNFMSLYEEGDMLVRYIDDTLETVMSREFPLLSLEKGKEMKETLEKQLKILKGMAKEKKASLGRCLGFVKQLADLAVAMRNATAGALTYYWDTEQLERETNVLREATLAYAHLPFNDYLEPTELPQGCYPFPLEIHRPTVPQSCDPNEMAGPKGVGERRLVKPGEWMTYTVYFENKADATGAAQEVRVTQRLDPRLDWSTFELVDVAYRNQIEGALAGKASGTAESALAGTPYKVRTEAAYDAATGAAEWYLRIVDETTPDKWPADAYAGILPPNNAAHEGEGHITYRVKVREDAPDGARIDASATIVFDLNAPIATDPAWWNTVAHTIASARFASPTLEAKGPEGAVRVVIHGGSPEADTAVTLRVLGGTMVLGKDYAFPEATTLRWEKGDTAPKTLTIAFNEAALAVGDKTILLGLEDAQGLALEAEGKTCAITLRRHIPTLAWPEGVEPSEALAAWVTEAAARQLIADGPLTFAPGVTLAVLEQARALGVFPEAEPLPDGGARIAVDVSLGVAELMPEGESLFVTAHIRAIRGLISEPCELSATFVLRGGSTLEEITWKEVSPRVVGRPTVHSLREATVPLCFPRMAQDSWFFRLRATQ